MARKYLRTAAASALFLIWGVWNLVQAQSPDYWPTKTWRTSTPEEQGMDSEKLADAVEYIHENDFFIHSLLVIRNGYVVLDAYFSPFTPDTKHDIASVTKSFTSTLIGVAVQKRIIKNLDQHVLNFFPDYRPANLDDKKKSIRVKDLLTMRSGLKCVTQPIEVTLFQMIGSPDWVQFMLDLPMADEPGAKFVYNSGGVHLLSAIIKQASGKSALEFAREHLFEPLGIREVFWPAGPQGNNYGWGSMRISPVEMAKLGYLFLKNGVWEGQQILPLDWVLKSTRNPEGKKRGGYGYLWWLNQDSGYSARGRGGQTIDIYPEKDLIIVMTGGGARNTFHLNYFYLMPAVKSENPLPPNPDGVTRMKAMILRAARGWASRPASARPLPETAKRISGKKYILEPNRFGLTGMTLSFKNEKEAVLKLDFSLDSDRSPEFKIGLDHVFRLNPGRFGIPAAGRGFWKSENTFSAEIDELGNINKYKIVMTFETESMRGRIEESTGIGSILIKGRLEASR